MIEIINELSNYRASQQEIISKYDLKGEDIDIITHIGQNGGFLDSYVRDGTYYLFSPI
jgi:hypothetical protein